VKTRDRTNLHIVWVLIYLTTLLYLQVRPTERLNGTGKGLYKLGRMWRETEVAHFKVQTWHLASGTGESTDLEAPKNILELLLSTDSVTLWILPIILISGGAAALARLTLWGIKYKCYFPYSVAFHMLAVEAIRWRHLLPLQVGRPPRACQPLPRGLHYPSVSRRNRNKRDFVQASWEEGVHDIPRHWSLFRATMFATIEMLTYRISVS
jgi:hypothetical protein